MPRAPLGYMEVGNISASRDARRILCKPHNHHKECENDNASERPGTVNSKQGCAETTYWRARARVGGKSGEKPVTLEAVAKTQGLAKERLKQRIEEFVEEQSGKPRRAKTTGSGLTLAAAMDTWLAEHAAEGDIAATTRERYERIIKTVVAPELGHYDVLDVTTETVKSFLKGIPRYNEETGKTERLSYIKHAHHILKATFRSDEVAALVPNNPMHNVPLKKKAPSTARRTAAKPLTPSEYRALRTAVKAQPRIAPYFINVIDILAGTGLRISEVLALRRENVSTALDTANSYLTIDSRMQILNKGAVISAGLKESRSREDGVRVNTSRIIVSPPSSVVSAIAAQLALAPNDPPDALLFLSSRNTPVLPANIRRTLRKASEDAGLEKVSPHSFRKMVAEAIRAAENDSGEGAADFLGNTPGVVAKHYLQPTVRTTSASSAAIMEKALSAALEEAS